MGLPTFSTAGVFGLLVGLLFSVWVGPETPAGWTLLFLVASGIAFLVFVAVRFVVLRLMRRRFPAMPIRGGRALKVVRSRKDRRPDDGANPTDSNL